MKKEKLSVEEFAAMIADKQDNVPLTEAQRNLVEHIEAGTCIMGEMRKDREDPQEKIKELEVALANALEINEAHQRLNGKLQVRIAELEDDNKKVHDSLDKKLEDARKAGL